MVGQLRTTAVWLGNGSGQRALHVQPPDAANVSDLLDALCQDWNGNYAHLITLQSKLEAVAEFHAKFLLIHPFLDGNGKVARALLMQQCVDLFGKADMTLMNKGADYYMALRSADSGDYGPLVSLLSPIVRG